MSDHMLDAEQAIERLTAECARLATERDNWQQRAEVFEQAMQRMAVELTAERDAALADKHCLRLELERIRAEAEGLRADLLAHPPEHAARIAELEAELAQVRYERDVALANSKERQAVLLESQQEHQRKTTHDQGIIEGLREALERTEKRYMDARARQVPRALVGLLGVIRREAAAAEKMIL